MKHLCYRAILGIVCGGLLVAPLAASAQPTSTPVRCPGIYYEGRTLESYFGSSSRMPAK
jgi:hypothetical protein